MDGAHGIPPTDNGIIWAEYLNGNHRQIRNLRSECIKISLCLLNQLARWIRSLLANQQADKMRTNVCQPIAKRHCSRVESRTRDQDYLPVALPKVVCGEGLNLLTAMLNTALPTKAPHHLASLSMWSKSVVRRSRKPPRLSVSP
jgi:hypothetical protein